MNSIRSTEKTAARAKSTLEVSPPICFSTCIEILFNFVTNTSLQADWPMLESE